MQLTLAQIAKFRVCLKRELNKRRYVYPAFDLKDTDFDGINAFSYLFSDGWTIEVIGNIYENPELLEEKC